MRNLFKIIYNILPFKKYLFLLIRPLKISESLYRHLHFKGIFTVKFNNYKFKIRHYGYQIENEIFWAGLTEGWEKISMRLWVELCKDSKIIFDIGANTGIYSLVAKSINPTSEIYGFEPVKRVYEKYGKNCELNQFQINCYNYAISNYDGEAVIYDTYSEHVLSVTVNKNLADKSVNTIETKINTKKLLTFIIENKINNIDLIKIDVETHEPEVLEGMAEYLSVFKPTLLIEILNDEIGERVQAVIKNIEYLYFNIDEINLPKKVDNILKSDYYNYLICTKSIAQKLNLI